ncbi:ABC transporter permease [Paractinoplanes ferrugineus]|uniref:ABC transporter permease n=1 Tax=Paractinoplanes ferrugineus TaxID=113564 RepID=UPI00194455E0|nr:ABC transporter permease [Actinoplanes ferrugineus]
MTLYLLKRLGSAIPILIGVSIVVFITIKIIPGDPVASLLGPTSSPQARAELTARLGLDQPLPIQYLSWGAHLFQGDLGDSIAKHVPVLSLVLDAFGNTLVLATFAAVVAFVLGILLGGVSALRRGRVSAAISNAISLFSISVPQYSIGLLLIIYLATGAGLFPTAGMYDPINGGGWGDLFLHLVLPGVTAALVPAGIIARMFRSCVIDVMSMDFIDAMRSRGLSELRILKHAFHNTLPTLMTIAGLQLGYLLGGVIFVETVFSWPGLGLLVYQSITQRDLPVIQAGVIVSALAFVVINVVVDVLQAAIDPRVRA